MSTGADRGASPSFSSLPADFGASCAFSTVVSTFPEVVLVILEAGPGCSVSSAVLYTSRHLMPGEEKEEEEEQDMERTFLVERGSSPFWSGAGSTSSTLREDLREPVACRGEAEDTFLGERV